LKTILPEILSPTQSTFFRVGWLPTMS
jgi:hypothetical protein